ncbi:uncharacterized protein MELLADRAFT_91530 [Melampsora larici-populina 98AG31]|uniref:Uncharacterized protein n=1 Tax=Melampsora larici-populina (strain 98AG31 / pathotype 3-4-7) TaxID=747676 RepID=F4RZD9_MELLP|nr:uncharacterized protein MELLADRAFT_91530 [Melampsora larici-populina 98AG31]EGG02272.1 hypothetical protein MELLADRAFT_91530 [Melampsora larici-populina 98AG31]
MNVYFHLRGVAGLTEDDRSRFMGEMNWPESLDLNDVRYEVVGRGYWGFHHYWCKIVRYVDGVRGVWHFDDRKDGGRAQLLGRDLALISGPQPSTTKITSKNPDAPGDMPFLSGDMEDIDIEDIKEDLPDFPVGNAVSPSLPSGLVTSQRSVTNAKLAFTAPASPAVDELDEDQAPAGAAGAVVPLASHQSSQRDKAKVAFSHSEKGPSSSAPPRVRKIDDNEEHGEPRPATQPEKATMPEVKGPLSVRLRVNKRPKSQSPSPQKAPKAKKGTAKGKSKAKVKEDKAGLPVVKEEVVEKNATPQPKGRKKK